jgi:DNA end-binding protein Ku
MPTKSAISFGLVHIPISLHTATTDIDIRFNQLHKDTKERIRYKKTCAHCSEEVKPEDIVKGFEYEKGRYVIITDDDFEKIKTEKDRTLQILHFTDLKQINPIYYEKTYQAVPELGGEKAFELLRRSMSDEGKIGIAKTVLGTKETLLALIPEENGILVETMFYEDEIKELPKSYTKQPIADAEFSMAKTLVASMEKPFDPSEYKDEYQASLKELISQKINGKETVEPASESQGNIIDLMEALKKSVENNKAAAGSAGKTRTRKKAAV